MFVKIAGCSLAYARLLHELGIWRRAWKSPRVWWRNDGCRTSDWRLDRLLQTRRGIPVTLSVIPDCDLRPLAWRLSFERNLTFAQQGVDHINRLRENGPRSEFPLAMPQALIDAAVSNGRARLAAAGLAPLVFVPPWNEASYRLVTAIHAAGFEAFSGYGSGRQAGGLTYIGAGIDITGDVGSGRFRGCSRIFDALRIELEKRRKEGEFAEPIGILTRHMAMDEASWVFLEQLVAWSRAHFAWTSLAEIVPAAARRPYLAVVRTAVER